MIPDMGDKLERYENGQMSHQETIDFFQELVNSGDAWTLNGNYGRTAADMMEMGLLTPSPHTYNDQGFLRAIGITPDLPDDIKQYITKDGGQ